MTIELTHEQALVLRARNRMQFCYEIASVNNVLELLDFDHQSNDGDLILTDEGREALAAYDAKWATVRKHDLQVAIEELAAKIAEHDELYAGYEDQLARMDDARRAMTRLREAVK